MHEESSSSPNDNLTIYGSRRAGGPGSGRKGGTAREDVEIILSDGSSFFVSATTWQALGLPDGTVVTPAWVENVVREAETERARERAISLLARREHSCAELLRKLLQRGFDADSAARAVAALAEAGYANDSRFADAWIRSRLQRRPQGRAALRAGLSRAGVDRETAEAAIDRIISDDRDTFDRAIARAAERLERSGNLDSHALTRKLITRGFSYQQIRNFLNLRGEDPDSGSEN
ncbi:MAG TPA: regulatory protein RecX [Spirochaetia bacterium]|nr:regulatory protein RecX [Spirochaetia bacterium]